MKILIAILLCSFILTAQAQEYEHGEIKQSTSGDIQVWNANSTQWSDAETFWLNFEKTNEGNSWGRSTKYPNYDDVNEFDTIIIELEQGACLMQFYHARWRRANDVQRWNDNFNEYGSCPYVFD